VTLLRCLPCGQSVVVVELVPEAWCVRCCLPLERGPEGAEGR